MVDQSLDCALEHATIPRIGRILERGVQDGLRLFLVRHVPHLRERQPGVGDGWKVGDAGAESSPRAARMESGLASSQASVSDSTEGLLVVGVGIGQGYAKPVPCQVLSVQRALRRSMKLPSASSTSAACLLSARTS